MIGKSTLVWLGLTAVASGILFQTSYRVQRLERDLSNLNRQIVDEQEAIQVLRAEWAFLNQPTQLARLTREHLLLVPTAGDQIASLAALPEKVPDVQMAIVPPPSRKPGHLAVPVVLASYRAGVPAALPATAPAPAKVMR